MDTLIAFRLRLSKSKRREEKSALQTAMPEFQAPMNKSEYRCGFHFFGRNRSESPGNGNRLGIQIGRRWEAIFIFLGGHSRT